MTLVQTEPKKIYKGSTEIKAVYLGDTKIRPSGPDKDYLCFTAEQANSTIKLNKSGSPASITLETSTDGSTWSAYTIGDTITLSNIGDKVYRRTTSTTDTGFSTSDTDYYTFVMSGSIAGSGDITSLLKKKGTTNLSNYCFYNLFRNCASLTSAPLLLPTTMATRCYSAMFAKCTGLTTPPDLPATTLADMCYLSMFTGCTALTTPPELPATTLSDYCYKSMFYQCTNLEGLPRLPATTLTTQCYMTMFYGCSKIKLSTSKTGIYQTSYRIPTTGTGSVGTRSLSNMFKNTGGTYTSDPSINTTYYTSNTVV